MSNWPRGAVFFTEAVAFWDPEPRFAARGGDAGLRFSTAAAAAVAAAISDKVAPLSLLGSCPGGPWGALASRFLLLLFLLLPLPLLLLRSFMGQFLPRVPPVVRVGFARGVGVVCGPRT